MLLKILFRHPRQTRRRSPGGLSTCGRCCNRDVRSAGGGESGACAGGRGRRYRGGRGNGGVRLGRYGHFNVGRVRYRPFQESEVVRVVQHRVGINGSCS